MGRHAVFHAIDRMLFMGIAWIHILWFPDRVSLMTIAIASLAGISVSLLLQYREVRRVTGFTVLRRAAFGEAGRLLFAGFPLALAMLAAVLFGPTVSVFLKHYCSAAEVGVYAAAWQLVMIAKFGLGQIGRIGNPAMARLACADVPILERRRTIGKYALVMLVAASPIALPSILCPELIITTLFSSEYAAAVDVLRILGVYILLLSLGIVASQCVISMRRDRRYLASVTIGGVVGIVSCIVLLPRYGAVGAAWALLISHGLSMALYVSTTIDLLFREDLGKGVALG
jgi:O-antigen/teichoic acid export membrane protein